MAIHSASENDPMKTPRNITSHQILKYMNSANVKLPLLLVVTSLFTSCAYSYSKIDGANRKSFEVQIAGRTAKLESPGGYFRITNLVSYGSMNGLLELHYDFLSGPSVYGMPYGETRIFLYEIRTEFSGIDEYVRRRAEINCEHSTEETTISACIDEESRLRSYLGQARGSWHLLEYFSESKRMLVRDYVMYLGAGVFLQLKGVVSDRAFERQHVRSDRIQMIEDIFGTLAVSEVNSGAASNHEVVDQ